MSVILRWEMVPVELIYRQEMANNRCSQGDTVVQIPNTDSILCRAVGFAAMGLLRRYSVW
jgi:hypothetical protein